jgi:hypothetical protein
MVKDEIIRVFDGERSYETFEELRESLWGQGVLGTSITIWMRRDNIEHEITIKRGLVQSFEYSYDLLESGFREFYKDWPDLKTRLVNAIESGDLVAYYVENQGTNTRYGCSALWAEFGFVRIQDGKITDWWSVEDTFSQFKQLGYIVHEPVLKNK